ncbi:MAG: hypothetical protein J6W00_03545 [Lentisphaeria bacterium]|nr:hypothetical protein [Lentisphaeria bacterium]
MNHSIRIYLAAFIVDIILTVLFFLLTPATGVLITAYIAACVAVGAIGQALVWAVKRNTGLFVTTAAIPLLLWSYASLNIVYSAIFLWLYYSGIYKVPVSWFVFGHIVFAGIYCVKLLAVDAGKEVIENIEVNVKESISNWKKLQFQITNIAAQAGTPVKKSVENVCEAVRYADPVSSPDLTAIEAEIAKNIDLLSQTVKSGEDKKTEELVGAILLQIKQRSEICKMLK